MTNTIELSRWIERVGDSKKQDLMLRVAGWIGCGRCGPWLVGGSVRRFVTGAAQDSDFDIGCLNDAQHEQLSARLLELCAERIKSTDFYDEWKLPREDGDAIKVQALKHVRGDAAAILDSFDFTLCQCAFDGESLIFGDFALWDIGRRKMAIHKVSFAVSTVRRLLKYAKQGYSMCDGCAKTLLNAVLDDPSTINSEVEYVD